MAWWNRLGKFLADIVTGTTDAGETAEQEAEEAQQGIDYGVEPDDAGYYPEPTADEIDYGYTEPEPEPGDYPGEITLYYATGEPIDTMTKAEWMALVIDSDPQTLYQYQQSTRDLIDGLIGQGQWDDADWAEFRDGYEKAHPGALHYTPYNRGGSSGYRVGA